MSQRLILKYWIQILTGEEAEQILSWRYQPPYHFYDPPRRDSREPIVKELLKAANGFYGIRDEQHRFVGFCSFGHDGRMLGGRYDDDAVDIGLGMKPQYTNQGRGGEFFEAIVGHAMNELKAKQLRLTVADFNTRAIKIYARSGFKAKDHFVDFLSSEPHTIMVRS